MTLCVDIGNTSICLGLFERGSLRFRARLASDCKKSADEYAVLLAGIFSMKKIDPSEISDAAMLSVVPALTHTLTRALAAFGVEPLVVGSGIKTGLNLRIESPELLGADIVADTVAALRVAEPPLIVLDLGTATTISVVNARGELTGCVIAPGVKLSLEALSEKCALLPEVSLTPPSRTVGRNTSEAINSGAVLGTTLMLDGYIDRIKRENGFEKMTIIATGGLAELILPLSENEIRFEPDLTLKGLLFLSELNRTARAHRSGRQA